MRGTKPATPPQTSRSSSNSRFVQRVGRHTSTGKGFAPYMYCVCVWFSSGNPKLLMTRSCRSKQPAQSPGLLLGLVFMWLCFVHRCLLSCAQVQVVSGGGASVVRYDRAPRGARSCSGTCTSSFTCFYSVAAHVMHGIVATSQSRALWRSRIDGETMLEL